jgi:eukaryotic-like serine/threonine-protein kinase
MSTKIGHFEILSELAKSATGAVYKANDPESGQTVALKAIQLSAFGEKAAALQQALTEEAESTKSLASPNITPIFGAGEMDGQFCVAMEYVQGNSIATMLARKEGFSIWDLLDIGRQVCSGLDQAHAAGVHHYSLEPAKIMCAWDGSIKILSMGASSVGKFVADMPGETPSILHYMSPEQVLGDKIDGRSNLFSIGAMFYEMVTDRKAFEGVDVESVRQRILDSTPVAPVKVNAKLHPLLSDLIMKALSKDPAERFQNGRELLDSLEKCKESKPQAANKLAPKPLAAAPKPPAAAKAVSPAPAPAPTAPAASRVAPPVTKPAEKFVVPAAPAPRVEAKRQDRVSTPAQAESSPAPKAAAAAAAGWGTSSSSTVPGFNTSSESAASEPAPSFAAAEQESPYMSAAVAEPPAFEPPKLAVDPMMAEDAPAHQSTSTSFSEISELPPLKEIVIQPEAPPPPPPAMAAPVHTQFEGHVEEDDKPRVNPREVAQKAIKEVKNVPPQLMLYSILGAVALILIVTIWLWSRIGSGDDDSGSARPAAAVTETQPASAQSEPVAQSTPQSAQQTAPETHEAVVAPRAQVAEPEPEAPRSSKTRNSKKKVAAPVIVPGQMTVDSTPQGAQVQLDGATDPTWVTPLAVSSLDPGPHSITISKSGYVTDSRTIKVVSGSKSSVVVHLNQLSATLSVTSNPPGANIYVDGRDMGKLTPAQVSVDKGQHVVLIRKAGYIDETASAQFALGQTVALSPTLRAMGNVDNIRTVGKMKKLFGGNSGQPGQGTLSIRTQPKGAQVAVNQHMLDKGSPVEVMLDPGNYVIDISLSGYAPISKVVTVDKGGKAVLDETMQPQ